MGVYDGINIDLLVEAILSLASAEECKAFLEDILTVKELRDMAQRLEVASHIAKGEKVTDVARITGASSATVTRVSRCYNYGPGGYYSVLSRMAEKEAGENA